MATLLSATRGTRMDAGQWRAIIRAAVTTTIVGAGAVAVTGWRHGLFTAALILIAFFVGARLRRDERSFDLSASLSWPSFSWLSPSWALFLRISWLTSWLSYRPSSSARPSWRPSL